MRHANQNIAPTRRSATSSAGLLLFVIAAVAVALIACFKLSLDYAVGYSVADTSQTKSSNQQKDKAYVSQDQTSVNLDTLQADASRDISTLYQEIANEEQERKRAEEEAARVHERECIERANARKAACGKEDDGVDFSVGKQAFVELWGERIDKYLSGSAMAGLGKKYAEVAFEYGVDPRVSPAISNTESTKGANCFRPHNAWGWMGSSGWSDWESAIEAHVKGLSEKYDYTISLAFARKYCPPTYTDWYAKTLNELNSI